MNNLVKSRFTPLDRTYPSCEFTQASLVIYSDELKIEEVDQVIDISPTKMQEKGDAFYNYFGKKCIAPLSYWILSSEEKIDSLDLRDHLDWLIKNLYGKSKNIHRLQKMSGIRMCVNCSWYSANGHGGPTIWPEQMSSLAKLNLECTFDIIFTKIFEQ